MKTTQTKIGLVAAASKIKNTRLSNVVLSAPKSVSAAGLAATMFHHDDVDDVPEIVIYDRSGKRQNSLLAGEAFTNGVCTIRVVRINRVSAVVEITTLCDNHRHEVLEYARINRW